MMTMNLPLLWGEATKLSPSGLSCSGEGVECQKILARLKPLTLTLSRRERGQVMGELR
jgi:hypothetical protein